MKIASVSVSIVKVPLETTYQAAGRQVGANWHVLARIRTSDGVEGFGYIVSLNAMFINAVATAARELAAMLPGISVFDTEGAWQRMARAGDWIGPGGLLHYAIAPLDIALWDAAGKTLNVPVRQMLGSFRDRMPAYASDGFWYSLPHDKLAENARNAVAQGFRAVKLRVGNEAEPSGEVTRVKAVQEAVGPNVSIMVDATETWPLDRAMRTCHALQEAGVVWIEDPVNHADISGMARLSASLEVPLATGEHLYQIVDYTRLLEARAAGVALIDLGRIGGVTPWRHVASLAHGFGVRVGGHVLPEIHIQLLTAVPNAYLVEYVPRSAQLLKTMPMLDGAEMVAPSGPGFGLELNADAVTRYTVEST